MFPAMRPEEFIAKWRDVEFGERQASQEMFLDICRLVGHPTPGEFGDSQAFTFEKWVPGGFADAYLEERFGWEFKGGDAGLDEAMNQLLRYQVHLKTPPLLIVSSFRTIRIRTNFPGMETVLHEIPVAALDRTENLDKLRWAFHAPAEFRPGRSVDTVTKETADLFQAIVEDMEQRNEDPEKLARYLNQIIFCLYAEDDGLLPGNPLSEIVRRHNHNPELFDQAIRSLFGQMATGGLFGAVEIAHFNGDLFSNAGTVELSGTALLRLVEATGKNWRNIEPSIFGTLFERALDASKRAHLGAHYTSAEDIMLVVEPVVMAPLRREWDAVQQEVSNLLVEENRDAARVRLGRFQQRLVDVEVLDPACGSGNFLYLALRSLLDLEKQVIDFAAAQGWPDLTPRGQARPDAGAGDQPLRRRTGPHLPVDWLHPVAPEQRLPLQPPAHPHSPVVHPDDRRHPGQGRPGKPKGTGVARRRVHRWQPALPGTFPVPGATGGCLRGRGLRSLRRPDSQLQRPLLLLV